MASSIKSDSVYFCRNCGVYVRTYVEKPDKNKFHQGETQTHAKVREFFHNSPAVMNGVFCASQEGLNVKLDFISPFDHACTTDNKRKVALYTDTVQECTMKNGGKLYARISHFTKTENNQMTSTVSLVECRRSVSPIPGLSKYAMKVIDPAPNRYSTFQ